MPLLLMLLRARPPPYIHSILSSIHISYLLHTHFICVSAISRSTALAHRALAGHEFLLNTIISTPFSRRLLLRVKPPPYIHSIVAHIHISYVLHTHLICVSATSRSPHSLFTQLHVTHMSYIITSHPPESVYASEQEC